MTEQRDNAIDRCARCGRPITTSMVVWSPTWPGELCSWCASDHAPDYMERLPVEDWWLTRLLRKTKLGRRLLEPPVEKPPPPF